MAKRIALYGSQPEQPLTEELFKRYSELQLKSPRHCSVVRPKMTSGNQNGYRKHKELDFIVRLGESSSGCECGFFCGSWAPII